MKIFNSLNIFSPNKTQAGKQNFVKKNKVANYSSNPSFSIYPKNYYLLNFEGNRVDKDLNSFYARNKDRMPSSVKNYIEALSDEEKSKETPMTAQMLAYKKLQICNSVDDIKNAYSDEELFENLKSARDSKATRGILSDIRIMGDDIKDSGEEILKDSQDLTVYLVKKLFFEAKTIDEINKDLEQDLNPVLRKPNSEENRTYITSATIAALGIDLPSVEYLTSLRYTKDGYSDMVGKKISEYFKSISDTKRAEILEAKAEVKTTQIPHETEQKPETTTSEADKSAQPTNTRPHTGHNISEETKKKISESLRLYYANLSPQEMAQETSSLMLDNEKGKYMMISAWNKCSELRKALSEFLISKNPKYKGDEFYEQKSNMQTLMIAFWKEHPEFAKELGEKIALASAEYDVAKEKGELQKYKDQVMQYSSILKTQTQQTATVYRGNLIKQRKEALKTYQDTFSFLPKGLMDFQLEKMKNFTKEDIELWIKYCKGEEELTQEEETKITQLESVVLADNSNTTNNYTLAVFMELEDCFEPIQNKKTGKVLKPLYPDNISAEFADVVALCYEIEKSGYQNVDLGISFVEDTRAQGILYDLQDISVFLPEYKYNFSRKPDFKKIAATYNRMNSHKYNKDELSAKMFDGKKYSDIPLTKKCAIDSMIKSSPILCEYIIRDNSVFSKAFIEVFKNYDMPTESDFHQKLTELYRKDIINVLSSDDKENELTGYMEEFLRSHEDFFAKMRNQQNGGMIHIKLNGDKINCYNDLAEQIKQNFTETEE